MRKDEIYVFKLELRVFQLWFELEMMKLQKKLNDIKEKNKNGKVVEVQ